jgi:hypothetical protein
MILAVCFYLKRTAFAHILCANTKKLLYDSMSYFPINFNMVKYVTKMSLRYEGEVFTVSHI